MITPRRGLDDAGGHLGAEGEVAHGQTMTRRNRPDAGKREYGAREVFYAGIAFHRTAEIMAEHFEQTKESDFMVSLYVNAALAAELFLKCLLRRAEDPREGHKLQKLFEALPEENQSAIRESFNATPKRSLAHVIAPRLPPTLDVPFDRFRSASSMWRIASIVSWFAASVIER